jgi:hypothetical protein
VREVFDIHEPKKSLGRTSWKTPQRTLSWICRSSAVSTAGAPNQSLNWAGIAGSNLMILLLDVGEVPYTTSTPPAVGGLVRGACFLV